ncbi:MAG: hypothetical protein ABSH41_06805 [Syntrophobacteraceae bacterium]|jgi:hypothetical protein
MPYALFMSYSRRDNQHGRVTQLVEHIQADFAAFAGRTLVSSFNATEIHGMDDWQHKIRNRSDNCIFLKHFRRGKDARRLLSTRKQTGNPGENPGAYGLAMNRESYSAVRFWGSRDS